MSLKGTKTEQNLKDAFAGESQANRRYLYFAQKADVEGYNDVATVFRSTAEGETGHAHGHLEFLEDRWHVTPGYPDVSCGCGTGVCKKSRIQKFIVENPEVRTVHIGNGRVSDLCASLFVDYVFAKHT